jgi:adenylate cyclase
MAEEIERKFLVSDNSWRRLGSGQRYRQGYLSTVKERTVRIRVAGDKGSITVKSINLGTTRSEYEYEIPLADANEMLDCLCERPLIEKIRYRIHLGDLTWEVDEFEGENHGLITAEIELRDENQAILLPAWIGREVTGDPRYFNSNPVVHRFSMW